jgi:hypothetical protein
MNDNAARGSAAIGSPDPVFGSDTIRSTIAVVIVDTTASTAGIVRGVVGRAEAVVAGD